MVGHLGRVLAHARARRGVLELAAAARAPAAVLVSLVVEGRRSAAVAVPSDLIFQRAAAQTRGEC
jgi:hypothetical protein